MLFKSANKNLVVTVVCSLLILQVIVTPKLCIDSALSGAVLFFNKVFPSLFPFLIITNIMMCYDGVHVYAKLMGNALCKPLRLPKQCTFVLIISVLCGYPLGAKYACDLYEDEKINLPTFQRLLNIATNASPLFVIGAVGTSMLDSPYLGYMLLLSNTLSCIAMGILIPSHQKKLKNKVIAPTSINISDSKNIGSVLKDSLENSIKTSLSIGSYVVIFSVIIRIIKSNIIYDIAITQISTLFGFSRSIIEGFILGVIEMTNGCYLISSTTMDMYYKFIIISFLLSFSGFSVISQVYSFTYKFNISTARYIRLKLVQGVISSIISIVIYRISFINVPVITFSKAPKFQTNSLFFIVIIIFLLPFGVYNIKKLFSSS
jgi:sporulation integral membrane protein YlbJ